ncbi:MAG: hypothetical protein ACT4PU_05675 [Planctomycetota bacterium]
MSIHLLALILGTALQSAEPTPAVAPAALADPGSSTAPEFSAAPGALHLSSLETSLAARLERGGRLDSGAALLSLLEAGTGKPLPLDMAYGPGPDLWASGTLTLDGLSLEVRALADSASVVAPGSPEPDRRLKALLRLTLTNLGSEPGSFDFVARLQPGGDEGASRPLVHLPFAAGSVWAHDGPLITRDGMVVLGWAGLPPSAVEIQPSPAGPDDAACLLRWTLPVAAQSQRYLDLWMAGPRTTQVNDETSFRQALGRWSYFEVEEHLGWQAKSKGVFAGIKWDKSGARLLQSLVGGVQQFRAFGEAANEVRVLSDRPFGHPASDVAAPLEIAATFVEWGLGEWSRTYIEAQAAGAAEAGQALSPERRLALAHSLVRCAQPSGNTKLAAQAANALQALFTEPAQVAPWQDPEIVRKELVNLLVRVNPDSGAELGQALPALSWATVAPGSIAQRMQAVRRAISAQDGHTAITGLLALAEATDRTGLGAMQAGGEPDAGFTLGLFALTRAALVDDSNAELLLLPALDRRLVPPPGKLFDLPLVPTRFGPIKVQLFSPGKDRLGVNIHFLEGLTQSSARLRAPAGCVLAGRPNGHGGDWKLLDDGTLWVAPEPLVYGNKVNATIRFTTP